MTWGIVSWLAPILLVCAVFAVFALRDRLPPRVRAVLDRIKPPPAEVYGPRWDRPIEDGELERLNALCRGGRNAWLSLLFVCVFAGVTLMGVQDADFFIVERETVLPLVGVSVPTLLFFQFAPLVIAALYANLHFHLLKVWEALSDAPPRHQDKPLSESLNASFIADLALAERGDGALQTRPMRVSTRILTWLLIFAAAPVLLGFFWWRSMPKHDELLTSVFCALPLCFALFIGLVSWHHMRHQAQGWTGTFGRVRATVLATVLTVPSLLLGSFATAGLLYHQLLAWGMEDVSRDNIDGWPYTPFLAKADLAGVSFTQLPADWVPYDEAAAHYGPRYCADRELPAILCSRADPENDKDPLASQKYAVCQSAGLADLPEQGCESLLALVEENLEGYWRGSFSETLRQLPRRDLFYVDFRGADLRSAQMQGAHLRFARMQGADLRYAQMEGANLRRANMHGADLRFVALQGADLRRAWLLDADLGRAGMQGADLKRAGLKNADLRLAQMQGAILEDAWIEDADLGFAQMQGAHLRRARLRGANLGGAEMRGADLRSAFMQDADLGFSRIQGAYLQQAQMQGSDFANAQMQGAFLRGVQMQGANLRGAQMQGAYLGAARMQGAVDASRSDISKGRLDATDLADVGFTAEQIKGAFGDGSVTLPSDLNLVIGEGDLAHWPKEDLSTQAYDRAHQAWLDSLPQTTD